MGILRISEYERLVEQGGGLIQCGEEPAINTQKITISGTHAESDPFDKRTRFVRFEVTTDHPRLPRVGHVEIFGIGGRTGGIKVSVIANT